MTAPATPTKPKTPASGVDAAPVEAVSKPSLVQTAVADSSSPLPPASSSISLPKYCTTVQPQSGITVVICESPPDGFLEKALPSLPAFGTSILALILSAYAIRYNFTKDARSRRQSIQDDFWLRKVVSPVSVEPFVKFTSELLANLPDATTTREDLEKISRQQLAEFRSLIAAFQALELLSSELHKKVESPLEAIEDRLARYFGDLDAFANGHLVSPPGRPEVITELSALRLAVLDPIKDHQAELGHHPASGL